MFTISRVVAGGKAQACGLVADVQLLSINAASLAAVTQGQLQVPAGCDVLRLCEV